MHRPQEEIDWHFELFIGLIQKVQDDESQLSIQAEGWPYVRVEKGRVYWKSSWTLKMSGQGADRESLALYAEKTELSSVLLHTKHQKPAPKVRYGDMSMTKISKNTLQSTELFMQRGHNVKG